MSLWFLCNYILVIYNFYFILLNYSTALLIWHIEACFIYLTIIWHYYMLDIGVRCKRFSMNFLYILHNSLHNFIRDYDLNFLFFKWIFCDNNILRLTFTSLVINMLGSCFDSFYSTDCVKQRVSLSNYLSTLYCFLFRKSKDKIRRFYFALFLLYKSM